MNHPIYKQLAALLFFVLLSFSALSQATPLADMNLKDAEGQQHSLHEYTQQKKWLVMVVWGPKCPACIEEMPVIQMMYDDMDKSRYSVLGLSLDYPSFGYAKAEQVKAFIDDNMLEFPNLLISADIFHQMGMGRLEGTPTIIIVNPKGEVVAEQAGIIPRKVIEDFLKKHSQF